MARLEDALRQAEYGAAYYDTPDGYRVMVETKQQGRQPSTNERYLVRVEHGAVPPTESYDAPDLPTAIALMRTYDLDAFDPTGDRWQPVTDTTQRRSTKWSDEMATRGMPPQEPLTLDGDEDAIHLIERESHHPLT